VHVTTVLRAAVLALLGALLLGAAGPTAAGAQPGARTGGDPPAELDPARLPEPARAALPLVTELVGEQCPELPPAWVVAQVQTESGWDASVVSGDSPGAAAGLLQLDQRTWLAAGGDPWPADPPGGGAPVLSAEAHLRVAVPWLCATLRAVAAHLRDTGKSASPLDAMLVCHLAGCGRVAGSATGVPVAGEAGCGERCADVIARYVRTVHETLEQFAPDPTANRSDRDEEPAGPAAAPGEPEPWTGGATGCSLDDPTGDGCVTGATLHGLGSSGTAFTGWSGGPVIRTAGCWDEHAWNPRSDHPKGKACDLFAAEPGRFAEGADLDEGWQVADWLRAHAEPLKVKYLIWQGRYWDPRVADQGGWGRQYTGGGVYDVGDATGGHYDHVHVSFQE
jgi:hypothetical protein